MTYDVIIVGAGLGGLTAGAKLSREGRKVLVIEQHSKPGGCATTFRRHEFTLEVGLHEMDGPSPRDMKSRIFTDLGVTGNVRFVPVPEFYRFVNGRHDFIMPHDPREAIIRLKKVFPGEQNGIDAFFQRLLGPRKKSADGSSPDISLGDYLDSIMVDDDLKLILLGNLGYFHDDPYSISLEYYSAAQGAYFSNGASYIHGGSQELSDYLAGYIRSKGGDVLLNHLVTRIIPEGDIIKGVEYRKKKGDGLPDIAYTGEIIINAAVPNLPGLLPEEYRNRLCEGIGTRKPGASLLTIYFGLRKSLKSIRNKYYSTFVFDPSVRTQRDILKNNSGDLNKRNFVFVDYGIIDSGLALGEKSVASLCCMDYIEDWDNLPEPEYNRKKEEVTAIFVKRLEELFPGFNNLVEYCETGTSATIRRYTLNPGGAVYGFARTPGTAPFSINNIFANMHIASAWGRTGGGFSGAILGGYLCAMNLLRKK